MKVKVNVGLFPVLCRRSGHARDGDRYVGWSAAAGAMVVSMTVMQMLLGALVLAAIIRLRHTNADRTWQP